MSAVPDDIADRAEVASERLARSRDQLRLALRESATSPDGASSDDGHHPDDGLVARIQRQWRQWRPLGLFGVMAARAANAAVRPLVERNPLGMALGATLAGALIAWSRPWRWIVGSSVVASLLPRLFGRPAAGAAGNVWVALLSSIAISALGSRRPAGHSPDPTVRASDRSDRSR